MRFGGWLNNPEEKKKHPCNFVEEKTVLVTDNSTPRAGDYSKAKAIFQSNYGLRRDWFSDQWSKIISLTSPAKKELQEMKSSAQTNDTLIGQRGPYDTHTHTHTSNCAGISFDRDDHKTHWVWVTLMKYQRGCIHIAPPQRLKHTPLRSDTVSAQRSN